MKRFVFVVVIAALTACAPEFNPPPGYVGGFLWDTDKSRTVTVQPGDTLYTISRRYDAPTRAIIARNGLTAPYALTAGQTLILDPAQRHTVAAGETLATIAATYDVDQNLLAASNDLAAPYALRTGQELWIPDPFTVAAAPAGAAQTPDSDLAPVPVRPPVAASAIVTESLAPLPGAAASTGSVMQAPEPAAPSESAAVAPPVSEPPSASSLPEAPVPITPAAPSPPVPSVAPAAEPQVAALPPSGLAEPAARAGAQFAWPISGRVIAGFGPAGRGLHNDGINIAAPQGAQIRAAENGVVAYAGNELKGFGNLLLIKHADGWTTAYAHAEKLLVNKGDQVTKGQVVATVGRTGNVDSPQLHFEVRRGTQAMNPMDYLAAGG